MGQTTTYQYDALNRVVRADYADGESHVYSYDTAINGIGRLASITDSSGSTRWDYDQQGHVVTETRIIRGIEYTTWYQYDAADRRIGMTYPSGMQLTYGYTNGQITSIAVDGQILASGIVYDALGRPTGWRWGNGLEFTRGYDPDGRLVSLSLAGDSRSLAYDPVGNITTINDSRVAQIFRYDALSRLTAANDASFVQILAYDANGNRTGLTTPADSLMYAYATGSNRLQAIDGNTATNYQYDANGNTLGDGHHTYRFDARNRLVSVDTDSAQYQYNALGQRVSKNVAGEDIRFVYDLKGRLIAKTDPAGRIQREYLYLHGQLIALRDAGDVMPAEAIYDNSSSQFIVGGIWSPSTSVSGYEGGGYLYHTANGLPPSHTAIDNGDPGFRATGAWTSSTAIAGYEGSDYQHHYANGPSPDAQTADNSDGVANGTWPVSTSVRGYSGGNYQYHAAGSGANSFTWSVAVANPGAYRVYARWTSHPNRATNATYTVHHAGGSTPVVVNQQ
ncbi:MAG TPA: hypothetical protein EYP40_01780, partial [Chromatiales bacterium]|nr:hypothetical protein [Chromatiales bacterium]